MIQGESVVHEVTYPYPPERVWRALVDPDELASWLMPNDFTPVVGRRFTMSCDPYGTIQAEVVELDPPHKLSCRWLASFGETLVTMQLTPTEGGTRLRVEHRGWADSNTADRDQFDHGWTEKLTTRLAEVLARLAATPPSADD
jgi:uncharacterized protein YndB with AHSA1/START domain